MIDCRYFNLRSWHQHWVANTTMGHLGNNGTSCRENWPLPHGFASRHYEWVSLCLRATRSFLDYFNSCLDTATNCFLDATVSIGWLGNHRGFLGAGVGLLFATLSVFAKKVFARGRSRISKTSVVGFLWSQCIRCAPAIFDYAGFELHCSGRVCVCVVVLGQGCIGLHRPDTENVGGYTTHCRMAGHRSPRAARERPLDGKTAVPRANREAI